jgi:hypothetical protein
VTTSTHKRIHPLGARGPDWIVLQSSGLVRNDWNPGILIELYFSPRDWCETIGIPSARYNLSQPRGAKGSNLGSDWIVLQSSGLVRNDWNPGILIELYFSPRDWCETIGIPSARYNLSQPCGAKGINLGPDWIVLQSSGLVRNNWNPISEVQPLPAPSG